MANVAKQGLYHTPSHNLKRKGFSKAGQIIKSSDFTAKRRTAEMTWGETAYAQLRVKKTC